MNPFENIDELFRDFKGETLNWIGILIFTGILLVFITLAIISFVKWMRWRRDWYTDELYYDDLIGKIEKHNQTEIKTWKESSTQAREQRQSWEDKFVEKALRVDELEDQLVKSANRVALTEGKLRAKSSKEKAMELTVALLRDAENEDLPGLVDATWKVIHKNIVQQ
jgi:hypothetical protein